MNPRGVTMDFAGVEAAVSVAYDRYLAGFHSHVAANVTPSVSIPLTLVSAGGTTIFEEVDAVERWLQRSLDDLLALEYDHTVMATKEVTVLDDGMALMTVAGDRLDTSGAVLETIAAVYTLVREADGCWRIAVMMPFAPRERRGAGHRGVTQPRGSSS
jgi:hypothetical protein